MRGKSGHHRAERRLITGKGDFKESATEINRSKCCKGGNVR